MAFLYPVQAADTLKIANMSFWKEENIKENVISTVNKHKTLVTCSASLSPPHPHPYTCRKKGRKLKKKKKSTIKTTKTICTQTCYVCACQPFVYNKTFGERILGNVQPLAASAWKAFVMPSFHLVHAFGFVNVSSQEHYPLAMFSQ